MLEARVLRESNTYCSMINQGCKYWEGGINTLKTDITNNSIFALDKFLF